MTKLIYWLALGLAIAGCKNKPTSQTESQTSTQQAPLTPAPAFNADSAYAYTAKQVAFGPRVPNTAAHQQTGDYLIAKFKEYGCQVTVQSFTTTTWDGVKLNARNIIASLNPQAGKRIVLASHWDCRPVADEDTVVANQKKPVPSANDGASGVAVMLELARAIQQAKTKPTVGIDLVCFDAEDWGNGEKARNDTDGLTMDGMPVDFMGYALGSRYWAKTPHKPGYSAYYGVLLDMVGGVGATFTKEANSMRFAPSVVNTIWQTASQLGYSQYFLDTPGGAITDDHLAPNLVAKIPMIDIIQMNPASGAFFPAHHTLRDDMRYIDRRTLKAVGQTLLQTLYNE